MKLVLLQLLWQVAGKLFTNIISSNPVAEETLELRQGRGCPRRRGANPKALAEEGAAGQWQPPAAFLCLSNGSNGP